MAAKEELFEKLANAINGYDKRGALSTAKEITDAKISPTEGIDKLTLTLKVVGDKFGAGELALPFLIAAAEAAKAALDHFVSKIPIGEEVKPVGIMVLGTAHGDIHDLGITIVDAVFTAAGFKVYNLGRDVPLENFIGKAEEVNANIIGMSALLISTQQEQRFLVDTLKERELKDRYIVAIGGGANPSEAWREQIGADIMAIDALDGLQKAKKLLDIE